MPSKRSRYFCCAFALSALFICSCRPSQSGASKIQAAVQDAALINQSPSSVVSTVYTVTVMREWASDRGGAVAYRFSGSRELDLGKVIEKASKQLETALLDRGFTLKKHVAKFAEGRPGEMWEISGNRVKSDMTVRALTDRDGPYLKLTYNINPL